MSNLNELTERVYKSYNSKKGFCGDFCNVCEAEQPKGEPLTRPLAIWHIGDKYKDSEIKVLFVGKAARNGLSRNSTKEEAHFKLSENKIFSFHDDVQNQLYNKGWAFWKRTRNIASKIFREGDDWDNIAITNFVKCNASNTTDTTTTLRKIQCSSILKEEISILKPTHVVFYVNESYDAPISLVFDSISKSKIEFEPFGANGKDVPMWIFEGAINIDANEKLKMNVLRCGHPERKIAEKFENAVVSFLNRKIIH